MRNVKGLGWRCERNNRLRSRLAQEFGVSDFKLAYIINLLLWAHFNGIPVSQIADPSSGWGGRLIGIIIFAKSLNELGVSSGIEHLLLNDTNPALPRVYQDILKLFNDGNSVIPKVSISNTPMLNFVQINKQHKFVVTCPPYINTEKSDNPVKKVLALEQYPGARIPDTVDGWMAEIYWPLVLGCSQQELSDRTTPLYTGINASLIVGRKDAAYIRHIIERFSLLVYLDQSSPRFAQATKGSTPTDVLIIFKRDFCAPSPKDGVLQSIIPGKLIAFMAKRKKAELELIEKSKIETPMAVEVASASVAPEKETPMAAEGLASRADKGKLLEGMDLEKVLMAHSRPEVSAVVLPQMTMAALLMHKNPAVRPKPSGKQKSQGVLSNYQPHKLRY